MILDDTGKEGFQDHLAWPSQPSSSLAVLWY